MSGHPTENDGEAKGCCGEHGHDPVRAERLFTALLARRAEFVRFLERKVGNAAAEDLLQEALLRATQRLPELREDEVLVGWFYRVLENAAIDHHRRRGVTGRALEQLAAEIEPHQSPVERAPKVCACVSRLATELKTEYADALKRIEIEGVPVKAFAQEKGISANNAGVRVFRARDALRKRVQSTCGACAANGCTDCTCGT
ncbi:MAG: sigma-70 family RNA polymerase sigma factor [Myxococcales bacterium]